MTTDPGPSLPVLSLSERRVLGVLVEKAKTTPDAYPLSLNALVAGCNQKSAREPVLNLSDADVEEALLAGQQKGLVLKITGGRVERWRHQLYEAWQVDKVELAVLAELLLRGPQTEGELRGRASRMEPMEDLERLRAVLSRLAERRLVVYLSPEGRRGTVVTHGFHELRELEVLRARHGATDEAIEPAARPIAAPGPSLESRLDEARDEIGRLRERVADLEHKLTSVAEQVRTLRESLGT